MKYIINIDLDHPIRTYENVSCYVDKDTGAMWELNEQLKQKLIPVRTEGDCISRHEAIDAFDGVKVDEENCTEYDIGYNDGIDFAVSRLSVLPSALPEIIRCRDCKFTDGLGPIADGRHWCVLHGSFMYYCSDAERRTDG